MGDAADVERKETPEPSGPVDAPPAPTSGLAPAFFVGAAARRGKPGSLAASLAAAGPGQRAQMLRGLQQTSGNRAVARLLHQTPRLARQPSIIEVEIVASRDEYRPPGGSEVYRVGDAAASRLLMDIQERGRRVVFRAFNFETGAAEEISPADWSFFRGAAIIGGGNRGIANLGRQLKPSEWRSLWPQPMPELLRRYEAGQLVLDDEAVLTGYRGIVRTDAGVSLSANEKAIDDLLGAGDRVRRLEEYATGLREAAVVRDALVKRRDELDKSLVQQHSFTFGLPKAGTGANMAQRLNIIREKAAVEDTLQFWISSFPLLSRLQTNEIESGSVEAKLREIKANIVATRQQLDRGRLDPMTLDTIRAQLAGRLGPKATAVIAAEDKSRSRWAMAGAAAMLAATIAILFLPGGLFIDAAIGVAVAGGAIAHAVEVGRAANTGLHVDEGLVEPVPGRVGAARSGARDGVRRDRRGGRRVPGPPRRARASEPEPVHAGAVAGAARSGRAGDRRRSRAASRRSARVAPGDAAVSSRGRPRSSARAGHPRAARGVAGVARFAAIPRRAPRARTCHEPLRRITDGSDIERIAAQTGLSRAEVEAAKRNLMLDEHILSTTRPARCSAGDSSRSRNCRALGSCRARGGAEPGRPRVPQTPRTPRARRGRAPEAASGRLEQAFFRGELEGQLRTFLQSLGWDQAKIARLLAVEPKPVTPYRYAHLVSALSEAPNP